MKLVKLFSDCSDNMYDLADEINDFLIAKNLELIDLKFSTTCNEGAGDYLYAILIYEEKKDKEKKYFVCLNYDEKTTYYLEKVGGNNFSLHSNGAISLLYKEAEVELKRLKDNFKDFDFSIKEAL